MRCFVALDLPAAVRAQLAAAAAPLRRLGDVKWVAEAQLHVTLKFLGDVDERVVAGMQQRLQALALPPLQLQLHGLGTFPGRGAPRVVWAGLDGDVAAMRSLAQQLDAAAVGLGVAAETRPFTPHVTLGRARSPRQSRMLLEAIGRASAELASPPFPAEAVVLYRSELTQHGAKHTPLLSRRCG